MTDKPKNKKRILFISLLIVVFACLIGAVGGTIAYYTNSTTSSNNRIEAGNLKIDLEVIREDGTYKSVRTFTEPVFDRDDFLPGTAQVANVRISNKGSLALEYELQVHTEGLLDKIMYNEPLASDMIEVYFAREELMLPTTSKVNQAINENKLTKIGTLTQLLLSQTILRDYLLAKPTDGSVDESVTYATIVLRMRADAGNTYQDVLVNKFDVKLLATQYPSEEDAFGKDYDIITQSGIVFDDGKEHFVDASVTLNEHSPTPVAVTVLNENTVVNIYDGYYDADVQKHAIYVDNGATVNIFGGTFFIGDLNHATRSLPQNLVYIGSGGGTVNVYGGMLATRSNNNRLLNKENELGKITVYGGSFLNWNPGDNDSNGEHTNYMYTSTSLLTSEKGANTVYSVNIVNNAFERPDENTYEIVGDLEIMNVPLFNEPNAISEPTVFNGNGHTVNLVVFPGNKFEQLEEGLKPNEHNLIPAMSTVFASTNGAKITVNDITFTGTATNISAGSYRYKNGIHNTEFNNVHVTNLQATNQSGILNVALVSYGTFVFNNGSVTGTTRSPLENNNLPVYDFATANYGITTFNNVTIGSAYGWEHCRLELNNTTIDTLHAKSMIYSSKKYGVYVNEGSRINNYVATHAYAYVKIGKGGYVGTLDLSIKNTKSDAKKIIVEEGGSFGKIIYTKNGVTYTFTDINDWYNFFS